MRNALAALVLVALCIASPAFAEDKADPMSFLSPLAGRTWIAEGKWSDGSLMKVEQRFFWGPTRRVLHFESYDLSGKVRDLLYEGAIFYDADRGHVVQWNFKPNGERNEYVYTAIDAKGFEAKTEKTWSIVRFVSHDLLEWELRIPAADGWKTILHASYLPSR